MAGEKAKITILPCRVKDLQAFVPGDGQVAIWWLGQAGFAVRAGSHTFLIDPYLSDSLAQKYKGKQFGHKRMMPIPVNPRTLTDIDWVFCTHGHTDHMDPETIQTLALDPRCRFFVPCGILDQAVTKQGLDFERTTCVNAGRLLILDEDISLYPIPSAHEEIMVNSKGEHHFLGYYFRLEDIGIYHSGDCVPYDGLEEHLRALKPDVALLPVNGRDRYRLSNNIPGNFHFEEALQLCQRCGIPYMIPHHFGLFDFNTVDPGILPTKMAKLSGPVGVIVPEIDNVYCVSKLNGKIRH